MSDEKRLRLDTEISSTMSTDQPTEGEAVSIKTKSLTDKMRGWREKVNENAVWDMY